MAILLRSSKCRVRVLYSGDHPELRTKVECTVVSIGLICKKQRNRGIFDYECIEVVCH